MKILKKQFILKKLLYGIVVFALSAISNQGYAQDSTASKKDSTASKKADIKIARVKNTFGGTYIIDNQTVMVPIKNTFEFAIQHRFGTINNGYSDFAGLFAPANIRLGWNYVPIDNLQLGIGICKDKMQWDGNVKYSISKQAKAGGCPVSVTYYGNMAVSTLAKKDNFVSNADRIAYFNQLIIARKITDKFSAQVAPSMSYFNNVDGYRATDGSIQPKMKNQHAAVAVLGRYMVLDYLGIIANYDQPLTQHLTNNPHPNISFGIEFVTIAHTFQIFMGNYQYILPQNNNFYNQNDYTKSQYLIGFNITRRWNFHKG